jgi:hypothetical protein
MAPDSVATAHTSGLGNIGSAVPLPPAKEATASAAAPPRMTADRRTDPLQQTAVSNLCRLTRTSRLERPPPPRTRVLCEVEMIEISRKIRVREVRAKELRARTARPPECSGPVHRRARRGFAGRSRLGRALSLTVFAVPHGVRRARSSLLYSEFALAKIHH